jgi:DNA-binding FadR family transcriptional regulator
LARTPGSGPAHTTIARTLGVVIVTGERKPDTILPSEVELAEIYGVSRSVVREAIRILAAKGLVESRQKAGTRIRPRSDWLLLDPVLLAWMFEGSPPLGFVRDLFELRMIVEPAAAELAAQHRTARHLSLMGHALERMAQFGLNTSEGQQADHQFHATILASSGNELLVSLSATISAAVRWTTYFKYRSKKHFKDPMPQHRALYEAIANGDVVAAREATVALVQQAQVDTEYALEVSG